MVKLTNDQLSLGGLAVSVFFCAGGYLIARSMDRLQDGKKFLKARIMRIFPLLFVTVCLCAFVMGPLITSYDIKAYFQNVQVYKYLLNGILILQHNLPGVFLNSPYSPTVNGPLWTLPVEFLCYICCYIMWKIHFMEKKNIKFSIPLVSIGILLIFIFVRVSGIDILLASIRPGLLFYIGIWFYVYRDDIELSGKGVILALGILMISIPANLLNVGMLIAFPYILFYISFAVWQVPDRIGVIGNISYGMYLCGYPIQQIIVCESGKGRTPYNNMLISLPTAIVVGYVLYKFVEVPITKWEKRKEK